MEDAQRAYDDRSVRFIILDEVGVRDGDVDPGGEDVDVCYSSARVSLASYFSIPSPVFASSMPSPPRVSPT